jgi:hypothetical protein
VRACVGVCKNETYSVVLEPVPCIILTSRDFYSSGIYPSYMTLCISAQLNNSQSTDVY